MPRYVPTEAERQAARAAESYVRRLLDQKVLSGYPPGATMRSPRLSTQERHPFKRACENYGRRVYKFDVLTRRAVTTAIQEYRERAPALDHEGDRSSVR